MERYPLAVFCIPPPTVEYCSLAVFCSPPAIVEPFPDATSVVASLYACKSIAFVPRGTNAIDLQAYREATTEVASGKGSTIAGGEQNTASEQYSTVGGGIQNTASGYRSIVGGGDHNTASEQYSTVGGGIQNTASNRYSTVGGGYQNTASEWHTTVGGGYQKIASAANSTVSGGFQNIASVGNSTVGGGSTNTASGSSSTVSGGLHNTAGGIYSTVGGGDSSTANGDYSTIAGGYYAKADKYGQNAYASGRFSATGDAQTSVFVVRNETSDATPTVLFLDGNSQAMTLNDQDSWTFRALVVGRSNDGSNYGSYIVTGYVYRNGGTTTITGVTTTTVAESSASYDATAVVNGYALLIQVTGDGTNTMRWVARVEVVQLNY